MNEYKECYIAFIDILGFKNIIKTLSCNEIIEIFENAKKIYGIRDEDENANTLHTFAYEELKYKIMSDSICIYIESSIEDSLLALITAVGCLQSNLLALEKFILCRGCIVKGAIYANEDIIFGPGYVEAYLLEENSAKFPRIILTNEIIQNAKLSETGSLLLNAFIKVDFDLFNIINWMTLCQGSKLGNAERIKFIANEKLSTIFDLNIREKYLYLRDKSESFIQDAVARTLKQN